MYINTALNYTGSKFKLLEQLLSEMDYTKKYFVDLFGGSGVVGFNLVDKYDKILYNDIITDLVGIHKGIIYDSEKFITKVKSLCVDKDNQEGFNKLRSEYNQNKTPEKLYALILTCTNNMIRYNLKGEVNQTFGFRSWNINTEKKLNLFIEHITPFKDKLYFINKDFNDVKLKKPCMVYIDCPYSNTEAGYNQIWKLNDDIRLYDYCKTLDMNNHSFMVSGSLLHDSKRSVLLDKLINDGYKYKELNYDYNKVSRKGKKETTEIIITNY